MTDHTPAWFRRKRLSCKLPDRLSCRFRSSPGMRWLVSSWVMLWMLASAPAWAEHRYQVTLDQHYQWIHVKACFDGRAPAQLITGDAASARYLYDLVATTADGRRQKAPSLSGGRLRTASLVDNSCLSYRVEARNVLGDPRIRYNASGSTGAMPVLLLDIQDWLWRPAAANSQRLFTVDFQLPPGFRIFTPWLQDKTHAYRFRVGQTPASWPGRIALGAVNTQQLPVTTGAANAKSLGHVELTILGDISARQQQKIQHWVGRSAQAIGQVHGQLPLAKTRVLVVPIGDGFGDEPVPWAEVQRGGSPTVHYFINQSLPVADFVNDWTPVHELSHLLHPALSWDHKWIYEGIASYYQNVARARAGLLTEQQAWQKLYQGFRRGMREAGWQTLNNANGYMQMYWSGAAIMLLADVELRERSQNRWSLDRALAAFAECCAQSGRRWSGQAFFRKLDELSGYSVFSPLYRQYANAREFPAFEALFADLGIRTRGQRVTLLEESRGQRASRIFLRKSIMQPSFVSGTHR